MISLMLALVSSNLHGLGLQDISVPTVQLASVSTVSAVPAATPVAFNPVNQNTSNTLSLGIPAASGSSNMYECQDLAVPMQIMRHVINVESGRNPYAIGVVGGHLVRQPRTLQEAVATADMLRDNGFNYSVGISQVNRYNFARYGLNSHQQAFDTCSNLKAGTRILRECYDRSGGDWGKSFSCYYSGNFVTGYKHGYVQKVLASLKGAAVAAVPENQNRNSNVIAVVSTSARSSEASRRARLNATPAAVRYSDEAVSYPTKTVEMAAPAQAPARTEPARPVDEAFVF